MKQVTLQQILEQCYIQGCADTLQSVIDSVQTIAESKQSVVIPVEFLVDQLSKALSVIEKGHPSEDRKLH